MGKIKCFKIMLILIGLFFVTTISPIAISDGCVFIPTIENWVYAYEEKQIGIIDYNNGIENLTLMIDIKNSSLTTEEAFWIFPVPGDPEDVNIGITKNVDFFEGGYRDIRNRAKSSITDSLIIMTFSQAYLSIIPLIYMTVSSISGMGYEYNDVEIHKEAEKMGMTSQLISANTSDALTAYLSLKNITLPESADNLIDEYIGKDYCFIVSWISNITEFKKQALSTNIRYYWGYYGEPFYVIGISAEFPTNDIYYPMKLTSIYGDKFLPILIQINGFVSPKNTYNTMNTRYYSDDGEYTEITINTQASEYTEDLFIENVEPTSVQTAKFIINNSLLFALIVFVICSVLASLTSAIIIYNKNKPDYKKFALLGFGNFLTIFFVFFISLKLKINEKFLKIPAPEKKVSELFDKGFKITFSILGLVCLLFFLLAFTSSYIAMFAILIITAIAFAVGILIIIYGAFKNPKVLLYTILFSVFFYIFVIISSITLNSLL
jgi:hypothetical protein